MNNGKSWGASPVRIQVVAARRHHTNESIMPREYAEPACPLVSVMPPSRGE